MHEANCQTNPELHLKMHGNDLRLMKPKQGDLAIYANTEHHFYKAE